MIVKLKKHTITWHEKLSLRDIIPAIPSLRNLPTSLFSCHEKKNHGKRGSYCYNYAQPETESLGTKRLHPKIATPTTGTGIGPFPSADNSNKPEYKHSGRNQVTVSRIRLQPLRQAGHPISDLSKPFHNI